MFSVRNDMLRRRELVFLLLCQACFALWPDVERLRTSARKARPMRLRSDRQGTSDLFLPRHVIPTHYDILLRPVFDEALGFPVQGRVVIDVECREAATNTTLHAADMTIEDYVIRDASGIPLEVVDVETDGPHQFLIFHLGETLEVGSTYEIDLAFSYPIRRDRVGFHLVSYTESGMEKYLGVTLFQPSFARLTFPCFDEPSLKARYDVTIGRDEDWTAFTNMPLKETLPDDDGTFLDVFETSLPMSTYTVCFAVTQFSSLTTDTPSPFGVHARPDAIENGAFMLQNAPSIQLTLEEVFKTEEPMPKMDLLALPQSGAGAMEHWGLVTFREDFLLVDVDAEDFTRVFEVNAVTSHELAHNFFGNLVTLQWWDLIWLNEGFASFGEYVGMRGPNPDWDVWQIFVWDSYQPTLMDDSLESTHPLVMDVFSMNDFWPLLDIAYGKGASLLNMIFGVLSEEFIIFDGIASYIGESSFGNVVEEDLWRNLQAAVEGTDVDLGGRTIAEIMTGWTRQAGYPLVTAIRDYDTGGIRVQQERFLSDPEADPDPTLWIVPVTFYTPEGGQRLYWLAEGDGTLTTQPMPGLEEFLFVNVEASGFYRVNYDLRNWELLATELERDPNQFPIQNRAEFLDDAFTFVASGHLPSYEVPLSLTRFLRSEPKFLPWVTAATHLEYLHRMFVSTERRALFQAYALSLLEPRFAETPFEMLEQFPEVYGDILDWYYNYIIQSFTCAMESSACVQQASELFQLWKSAYDPQDPDRTILSPNAKSLVYLYGIYGGDDSDWEFGYQHYQLTGSESDKNSMLLALASYTGSASLTRLLDDILSPTSPIRDQDALQAFLYLGANIAGRQLAFDFLRDNWDAFKARFQEVSAVVAAFQDFNTPADLDALTALRDEHPQDADAFAATVAAVRGNIAWMDQHFDFIVDWLNASIQ
ncbi:unnamed protein product [Darwinula stevensoni]|uniref:Aminopeptidase n=1 Tax=Darwinula stevensoni TaxID=69355 RepID=A0A7R9FPI2_9CRUS|nr:unnamed protein product [Darwinula stevensoni]CAG0897985.1 unnamed protein product [Darwinula stevensoni]